MTRDPPTAEEEFKAATVVYPPNEEAKRLRIIAAKDAAGNYAHVRWRQWPDSDTPKREDHRPYFAEYTTDEIFDLIAWVPSCYTDEDLMKVYIS